MLESKNKVFQNIVRSADADRSADVSEQLKLMRDLNDRFVLSNLLKIFVVPIPGINYYY